jgi:hypothetical protein
MKDIINKLSQRVNNADELLASIVFNKISNSNSFKELQSKDLEKGLVTNKPINIDLTIKKKSIGNYDTIVTGDVNDIKKKDIGTTGSTGSVVQPSGIILKLKKDLKSDLKHIFKSGIKFS